MWTLYAVIAHPHGTFHVTEVKSFWVVRRLLVVSAYQLLLSFRWNLNLAGRSKQYAH